MLILGESLRCSSTMTAFILQSIFLTLEPHSPTKDPYNHNIHETQPSEGLYYPRPVV